MGADRGTVDQSLARWTPSISKGNEDVLPYPFLRPPNEAVVERLTGAIIRRSVHPSAARLKDMDNARDHATIIDARNPANFVGQQRSQPRKLPLAQPKQVIGHIKLPSGVLNHRLCCCPRTEIGPFLTVSPSMRVA